MKPTTQVWIRFENLGKPADKVERQVTIRQATLTLAEWLLQVYMGQKIRITLARTQHELADSKRSGDVSEMMGELESMLADTPEPQREDSHD